MACRKQTSALLHIALGTFAALTLSGCALALRGTQQTIKVDAVSVDGSAVGPVECRPLGAGESTAPAIPNRLLVRRSGDDLSIQCLAQGRLVATAKVISRSDMGLVSLVVGGVLSATVDHVSGAAYAYPEWITLVAGEDRVYDRRESSDGPYAGVPARPVEVASVVRVATAPQASDALSNYYRASYKVTPEHLLRPGARPTGRDTYGVEKLAATMNCSATPRAVLVERGGGYELHRVRCTGGEELAFRCEFGNCRVEPGVRS
ncbi:hypothetical protein QTH87_19180 [Variovorax sp. J22P168]|uniref:hypothetical protein n=1 Tax=Variovorax jilinensis TaxID=3053513 RepID=UPI002575BE78|nr:hypothetical protein [Variovorax sp. J22P168]MDM0014574.1 hypothetical protein [Variovorax sp. J22P168]